MLLAEGCLQVAAGMRDGAVVTFGGSVLIFFHARMTARFCLFPNLARRSRDTAHVQRTQRYCKFIIHGASEVIKTDRQFRSSYTPLWSCDGPKSDSDHSGSPLRSL